jgi:hypothetical protein
MDRDHESTMYSNSFSVKFGIPNFATPTFVVGSYCMKEGMT